MKPPSTKIPMYLSEFFMLIISILFSYFLIGQNFNSKLGMIDDHQIINILGPDLRLKSEDLLPTLKSNIIGTYGTFIRQVPAYLVLRTFEIYYWGNNPFLWYLTRFIMLVISIFITWHLLRRYIGITYGFIFILFIMSADYWSGILTRLGTHEIYVLPGLVFYILGFINALKVENKKHIAVNWLFIFIGTLIAAGSKENLVILAIPTTLLFCYLIFKKNTNVISYILFILSILVCFYVSSGVYIVLKNAGHDVYSNNISIEYRLRLFKTGLVNSIASTKAIYFLFVGLLATFVAKYNSTQKEFKIFSKILLKYFLLVLSLFLFYASQFAFYNGQWPTGMRYDFPGLLVTPFYWLTFYFFCLSLAGFFKTIPIVTNIFSLIFFGYIFIFSVSSKYEVLRKSSFLNASETANYSNKIEKITKITKQNQAISIIFNSYNPYDYEGIASVNIFLTNYGVKNNKYLQLNNISSDINPKLAEKLKLELIEYSNGKGKDEFVFQPLSNYKKGSQCLSIGFGKIPTDDCQYKESIP